jgi:hypothetical protein
LHEVSRISIPEMLLLPMQIQPTFHSESPAQLFCRSRDNSELNAAEYASEELHWCRTNWGRS